MTGKRYLVPQVIKDAVHNALASFPIAVKKGRAAEIACEAFARAFTENPIVPTDGQLQEIDKICSSERPGWKTHPLVANAIEEWQRRMFLAPEQEAPDIVLAKRIADNLFTSGFGEATSRLVLISADGRDLGGWCKPSVIAQIVITASENSQPESPKAPKSQDRPRSTETVVGKARQTRLKQSKQTQIRGELR